MVPSSIRTSLRSGHFTVASKPILLPAPCPGAGVVENVHRAVHDFAVALRVAIAEEVEEHVLFVVHVHVLVDHDDELGEAHLPGAPDGVHHAAGLVGVFLADFHVGAIVEHAG
jgi:hypothetical protein